MDQSKILNNRNINNFFKKKNNTSLILLFDIRETFIILPLIGVLDFIKFWENDFGGKKNFLNDGIHWFEEFNAVDLEFTKI